MSAPLLKAVPSDLYITEELDRRSVKPSDHLTEKRALQDLAARMVKSPSEVLPRFVELAMQITGGVSAGLSLYEPDPAPGVFRWRYLIGTLSSFENALTPRDFSPCGVTLDQGSPVLSCHPERFYNWISDVGIVVPEVLLVPLHFENAEPLGTLWIVAEHEGHFHAEHARAATELAQFAGIALQMMGTEGKLQTALEEQQTLAREMSHRVKNLFAIAQGLVQLTARSSQTKDEMTEVLTGRFQALANAHGLVRRSFSSAKDHSSVLDLKDLLRAISQAHERPSPAPSRFSFHGPSIALGERTISSLALVFNELITNAAKYGALSADSGRIILTWTETPEGKLAFHWCEENGPEIAAPPETTGFGSKLLRDTVIRTFGGELSHDWSLEGLRVRIALPVAGLAN